MYIILGTFKIMIRTSSFYILIFEVVEGNGALGLVKKQKNI